MMINISMKSQLPFKNLRGLSFKHITANLKCSSIVHSVKSYRYLSSNLSGLQNSDDYIPRRALMYIPGNDIKKLGKIKDLDADCLVMDCEDGVADSKKAEARDRILQHLTDNISHFKNKDCSVRVNGVESGLFVEDVRTVLSGPNLPRTILLPKVENSDHISLLSEQLKKHMKLDNQIKLRLIIYVESAISLLSLPKICDEAIELSKTSNFLLDGIVFGSDDFCADIGATRTSEAKETLFARQWTVTTAKAYKLQAIDIVYIDYKDLEGLRHQSLEGAQMGFTGKQVIHPGQIKIVQEAFSPSEEKVIWAHELIKAFHKHQLEGKGAFTFRGNMIDRPLLRQALNIINIAKVPITPNEIC